MTANVLGRFNQSGGVANFASGLLTTGSATAVAVQIVVGFVPRHVRILNETDVVVWEKFDTMVAANTLKHVTAGDMTIDTGSAIVFDIDPGLGVAAESFTISTAISVASKVIEWAAWG
jgi:hypothetical protein